MYIKKEDFNYFEKLYKSLEEKKKKSFLDILLKSTGKKSGQDIAKIEVVGDEIFDTHGTEPGDFITRTAINKAYKEAREI